MLHGKSIICFGGEDWWYHHPHSKNHLMRRFARAGNKVIFVNSISMGLAPMKSGELLPRIKRKLKSYAKLARTTEEGITVVSPAVIPVLWQPRRGRDESAIVDGADFIAGQPSRAYAIRFSGSRFPRR